MARKHLLLVGLPGSGKTTAGALAAERLGARFHDVDQVIERRTGKSVAAIFEEQGEAAFRALEAEVGASLLEGAPAVLAPGGGFFADAKSRSKALAGACVVYLETSPATAASRLTGQDDRPLLKGGNAERRIAELLGQREAAYLEAENRVTTDRKSVAEVADELAAIARSRGGW